MSYTLIYQVGTSSVGVNLLFTGDRDGETLLILPGDWGGEVALYNAIRLNSIIGASVSETTAPNELLLNHEPGAWITVNYDITQDWQGPPSANGRNPYRPIIQADYVHLIGWAALVVPQFDAWSADWNGDADVRLDWDGWPESWTIADNIATGVETRQFTGDINRLQAGLFVAGDFTLTESDVDGAPFRFAVRGDWPFGVADLISNIEAVVQAQRDFWGETSENALLVTLIPLDTGGDDRNTSWGGTGLVDSFALFATTNTPIEQFQILASHEFMHRWIMGAFGRVADPEEATYWFSEGFTDYFATLVQLRAGLIDLQGFADQNNAAIAEYYRSPVRGATHAEFIERAWLDANMNRYSYLHGRMLAARWNAELMVVSRGTISLADFMRGWLSDRRAIVADGGTLEVIDTDVIVDQFTNHYYSRIGSDARQFITDGETVPIEQGMFGPCFEVHEVNFPVYEIGLDLDASYQAQAITGLVPGGAAARAGLREGQRLYGYSISQIGDPTSPVTIFVADNTGAQIQVQYLPQSEMMETIPQIALPDPLMPSVRDECLASFAR